MLGKQISEKIYGTESPVGKYVSLGGIYYRVVGMAGQTSEVQIRGSKVDEQVLLPMSTMRRSFTLISSHSATAEISGIPRLRFSAS